MATSAVAAALAAFVVARGALFDFVHRQPANESISAQVMGSLEYQSTDNRVASIADSTASIATGDAVQNTSSAPATVGITPHLAVTLDSFARVHFSKVHTNPQTSMPDVIDMHVDRGSVTVHEVLHRDASPIHVATNEATLVPTGTAFQVAEKAGVTQLAVNQGSVAVYLPGHVYNVRAGEKARVTRAKFLRETPASAHEHPVLNKNKARR
jgi:hypothetical protein